MADILLSVGVQTGTTDVSKFREGINDLVTQINKDPPKVEVGVEVSKGSLDTFRKQLSSIINGITLSNGSKLSIKIDGVGEVNSQADRTVKAIEKISDAAKKASASAEEMQRDLKSAMAGQEADAKKQIKNEKDRIAVLKQAQALLRKMQDAETNWTKASTGRSKASYAEIQNSIDILKGDIRSFSDNSISIDDFKNRITALSSSFDTLSGDIRRSGENTQTFMSRFGKLTTKFTQWFGASQLVMQAISTLKKMVSVVVELDTAMTELKKVTDATNATYDRFLDNAVKRAKTVGASLTDVVTASADFARLGYDLDDAAYLADTAIIYKNVADGISDISVASESIISTMQAFGIATEDAMSIVDKFNNVSNNFAISSAGVGEALQRSAAAMKAAGANIDETIALITAANTVVQNPESVGTTLKTVSMYLRAAKTEAEEAGESTDGMASSVSELRDEILKLTGYKVDLQIDEDSFKDPYQILKELAGVWKELTDVSRANILEMIGGKRNANVVSALLENFNVAEEVLKTSMDSEGSALAENAKYLESIRGKLDQFNASWQALSTTVINSDWLKHIVDAGTAVIDTLDGIMNAVNPLLAILTGGGFYAFFKNLD